MRAIDHKLVRDCLHMRGQLGAIALVVASAVAMFVTMRGSYEALLRAQSEAYANDRFPSVFAHLERAPRQLLDAIRAIGGVTAAEGRIVYDVSMDVPRLDDPAVGRLISLGGDLSRVRLRRGRLPDGSRKDEVVASEQFCLANHLEPGDTVQAVINGHRTTLLISGIGSSPEYINEISGLTTLPDHRRFGVLWMPASALEGLLSMRGAFNDLVMLLGRDANEREVIAAVDGLLARWGGVGAHGRKEQPSDQVLQSELAQDRVTALLIPSIFLFVAAFLIHMVVTRLVAGQRDQIAILRAFGYSTGSIALHYVGFAAVVVIAGIAGGIPLGTFLGIQLTDMYLDFFNLPYMRFSIEPFSLVSTVAVTAVAAVAGATVGALRAAAIPPAEGMRGEQPPSFHSTRLESLNRLFSPAGRMIARSIQRRPARALLAASGISLAIMILMVGRFSFDAIDTLIEVHFRSAQRDDVMVSFSSPRVPAAAHELERIEGVRLVEPFRAVPVRIRSHQHSRKIGLLGLDAGGSLRRLMAADRRQVSVPDDGIVLTTTLATLLGAGRGDSVTLERLDGNRRISEVPVVETVDELIGIGAFASRRTVARLIGEGDAISGAWLSVEPSEKQSVSRALKTFPGISSATYREGMLQSFHDTLAKNLRISMTATVLFACIIAVSVIYNSARIALSERGRDLATLRVLGFSHREAGALLLGEQAILTLAAVPPGFLLGRLASLWLARALDTEDYRLVDSVQAGTYGFALVVLITASAFAAAMTWRRIRRLDLVEVLKTRE